MRFKQTGGTGSESAASDRIVFQHLFRQDGSETSVPHKIYPTESGAHVYINHLQTSASDWTDLASDV